MTPTTGRFDAWMQQPVTAPLQAGSLQPPSQASIDAQGALGGGYSGGTADGGLVTLRAPNGQLKAVPAAHVGHYLALGAQRG
jgi:hypothetical protein